MEEEPLEEGCTTSANFNQLEESQSIRRIKEEWTRLQVEADGLQNQLLKDAGEVREGGGAVAAQGQEEKGDSSGAARENLALVGQQMQWRQVRTLPRSRMPSLDSMQDPASTFPSINARSSLRKNILEASYAERPGDNFREREPPEKVTLGRTAYSFGSDTPTQTDIKWTPPANAQLFSLLLYDIEVDGGQGWTTLSESRLPILRVYFTSEKIIMGRFSRVQEAEPVSVRLRVRAMEKVMRQAEQDTLRGPWSEEIWLTLEGSHISCSTAV